MSKYEEALERVGAIFVSFTCNDDGDKYYCHLRDNNDYEETYNVLQDAVAKAEKYDEMMKPKKVIKRVIDKDYRDYVEEDDPAEHWGQVSEEVAKKQHLVFAGMVHMHEEWLHCPTCQEIISVGNNRCPHCGQALEWEEGEKK